MENEPATQPPTQPSLPLNPLSDEKYFKFAGFPTRLTALIIDIFVLLAITIPLTFIVQALAGQSFSLDKNSPFRLLVALVSLTYNVVLLRVQGATLGKKLVHIRVVNNNYQRLSLIQTIKREILGKIVSNLLFSLGYLWVAIDDKKQGWHDKIAKTYVIHEQPVTYPEYLEANKRSDLPFVFIIFGVLEAIPLLLVAVFVIPSLHTLYESFNIVGYNLVKSYILLGIVGVLALAQIIYGLILLIKQRRTGTLGAIQKKIAKIILVIGAIGVTISLPLVLLSVISPMYNLTNQIAPVTTPNPTPTPDLYTESSQSATANWKTYKNEKLGFEFKYPANIKYFEYSGSEKTMFESKIILDESENGHVRLVYHPNPGSTWTNLLIDVETRKEKFINLNLLKECSSLPKVPCLGQGHDVIDFVLDGVQAKKFYAWTAETISWDFIQTINKPYIEIMIGDTQFFNQILSSFRFLDNTTPAPTKPQVCIQVITPAKDPQTGECKEFPTPCDVPEGWDKVGSCQ